MQYIIEGMLLHNKKQIYKICLELSPKTKEISRLIRGLNIFPRKKSKTERNWGSRPSLRWRWFTKQTWFLQSGQVELDSNHMSMQLTWKQWLHLGNFLNLSPSTTSWRHTTQNKMSLLPEELWWKVNIGRRWWLCQKFFEQKWMVKKMNNIVMMTMMCLQLLVVNVVTMELAILTINSK